MVFFFLIFFTFFFRISRTLFSEVPRARAPLPVRDPVRDPVLDSS